MDAVYGFRLGCDMDVAYTNLVLQRPDKEDYRIHKVLTTLHNTSEELQTRSDCVEKYPVPR